MTRSSAECLAALRHVLTKPPLTHVPAAGPPIPLGACGLDRALGGGLARGALHEVVAARPGDAAAAFGFAAALAVRLAAGRVTSVVCIIERHAETEGGALYPPGLAAHGLDPARMVVVLTRDARETLWATEEALRSPTPAAVVAEIWGLERTYDLAASRRLVLAAARSGTPGLLLAAGFAGRASILSSGARTRFEIRAGPSLSLESAAWRLPQPGLPIWDVRLAKLRLGSGSAAFDRDRFMPVVWDHQGRCFRDALSRHLDALPAPRPSPAATGGPVAASGDRRAG